MKGGKCVAEQRERDNFVYQKGQYMLILYIYIHSTIISGKINNYSSMPPQS